MATILYVDDELSTLRALSRLLRHEGYVVLEADGTEEGIRVCQQHSQEIDLLLIDYNMPPSNGPNFELRAKLICPKAKVLYYTGYELIIDTPHKVVQKGTDLRVLIERIEQLLKEPEE